MILDVKQVFTLLLLAMLYLPNCMAQSTEVNVIRDVPYGADQQQRLDVYRPKDADNAPVIFMVHGGAWRIGDKASGGVVRNKVSHWVSKGFVFISVNYRLVPDAAPLQQAKDVESALRFSQKQARKWGGSPDRFILMGHSAGAHLVSLIASRGQQELGGGVKPWLGVVAIDSAAYDIVEIMTSRRPPRFYKKAFGTHQAYWKVASPIYALSGKRAPFLAICSTQRKDAPCVQAEKYVQKSRRFGTEAKLLKVDLSHRATNVDLGKGNSYTRSVDRFLMQLHPDIASLL